MPEYIRAFLVICFITFTSFALLKKFALAYISNADFNVWRNSILIISAFAFLSHNFWLLLGLTFLYILYLKKRIKAPGVLFFILLFIVPQHMSNRIGAFGLNYLFEINYVRLIILVVLYPAFLKIRRDPKSLKFGRHNADIFFIAYLFIYFLCDLRGTTYTDGLRHLFNILLDTFLPYYILSRTIKTKEEMNIVLLALFVALIVSGNMGVFEHVKHWLLYDQLPNALNTYGAGGYLARGDDLRAMTIFGAPIILGYMMTVALGLFLYLKEAEIKLGRITKIVVFLMLLGGMYAPVSRGPWVGAVLLYIVVILYNKNAIKNLFKFTLVVACISGALLGTPQGDKLYNLLPFVGETEKHNVDYRKDLFNVSMTIIDRYPFFGTYYYLDEPEMVQLYQGDVSNADLKVDIVNSYIGIALERGFVGVILFVGIFASVLLSLTKSIKKAKKLPSNEHLLGTVLFAIILSMMVMIATVSSILAIPVVNFAVLGLAVAYTNIINNTVKNKLGREATS